LYQANDAAKKPREITTTKKKIDDNIILIFMMILIFLKKEAKKPSAVKRYLQPKFSKLIKLLVDFRTHLLFWF
jgi:hypothetical protein